MIEVGSPELPGSVVVDGGVSFAVFAPDAARLQLCLFDGNGSETRRLDLPAQTDGIWHGFVPGIGAGQVYGFRAHGSYDPDAGLRFNPHKLLLDPYARAISGSIQWCDAVFDFDRKAADGWMRPSAEDSAPYVPKSVVTALGRPPPQRPAVPWNETLIYELNVRGFSMRHPAIADVDRGRFAALKAPETIAHLQALGVTTIELMPIHAFADEEFLVQRGLRNYWGYNSYAFFAPEPRYLGPGGSGGLGRTIDALHDAGIEVLLDVVYNHTAEGGRFGPMLSFRGLANDVYYRLVPDAPGEYINDTGCGNTINTDHPVVRRLIVDSLRHWVTEYGVDGFRFDLASILGRTQDGFDREHPIFDEMRASPELREIKLIAEPWDIGPGGYQLGAFPGSWAEWNDQFRDTVRRFWRRDPGLAPEFARRVHGSADIFEPGGRGPDASINFVASHDGFTVQDLVSFAERHNEANGEDNRDGHVHNFSTNHGIEGACSDARVVATRRRHRLNLLATLLLSQGTPMLLAGDEFGNSQSGNNNAYAQDNWVGWLDWAGLERDPEFFDEVAALVRLRLELPLLRQLTFRHGEHCRSTGHADIEWFGSAGEPISEDEWPSIGALGKLLSRPDSWTEPPAAGRSGKVRAVCILYNALDTDCEFTLPVIDGSGHWRTRYLSSGAPYPGSVARRLLVPAFSIACLAFE